MSLDESSVAQIERRWAYSMAGVAVLFLSCIFFAATSLHMNPPSNIETVDPVTMHLSGEFVESNLGTQVDRNGRVITRVVTAQFAFQPSCVIVPQDTPVTLRFASPDVIHGITILGTNVNTMVVPGYVSQVRTSFAQAGEVLMPCHEFCGLGHSQMIARVRVVPADKFTADENGKASCEQQ